VDGVFSSFVVQVAKVEVNHSFCFEISDNYSNMPDCPWNSVF
jgi:hypothetical protein